jgi:hypothetical protein
MPHLLRTSRALTLVMLLGVALAGCSHSKKATATTTTTMTTTSTAGGSPPPADSGLKAPIQGLVDKDGAPPATYQGVVRAYVVRVPWSQLQPVPGGPIATGNAIDQAISYVRQENQRDPTLRMTLKLRVAGGAYAPSWAKQIGGAPVALLGSGNGTIGRFWLDDYGRAYQDLQNKLAAEYDSVPELREVVVARCMTFSDEPFVRDASNKSNASAYVAAGYSVALDHQCQEQQIDESTAWKHTLLDVSFNPAQEITPDGTVTYDEAWTENVMVYCRQKLGKQCVLENNSLSAPVKSTLYRQLYVQMKTLGAPLCFQTQDNAKVTDMSATLRFAIQEGAASVELHEGFEQLVSPETLAPFDPELQANHF